MLRPLSYRTTRRRGVILMVVLALLALFAIVGLAFVLYAQNSHRAATLYRDHWPLGFSGSAGNPSGGGGGGGSGTGGVYTPPDINSMELFRWAMGQLIYDVDDGAGGAQSSIRGHSLARTMYGYDDGGLNLNPFNGAGRKHADNGGAYGGLDDYQLVNYKFFPGIPVRDPERVYSARANPTGPRGGFEGGANSPSTYPDLNNFYLGAARADGTQMMPSLHRPWLFGSMDPAAQNPVSPTFNANWTNFQGRFLTARPRPADNLVQYQYPDLRPGFPYPSESGGDVKNRLGYPGGNDSIWVDLGFPKRQAPDGRWYKPLFAFYVEDLDNKLNLNTAGNLMARANNAQTHGSNQGWGKWEANLARVFNRSDTPAAADEWRNLFLGNGMLTGRYGSDVVPRKDLPTNLASGGKYPRFGGQFDYNASDENSNYAATGKLTLAATSIWPTFPSGYSNGFDSERLHHARLFDYFRPYDTSVPQLWVDYVFPVRDIKGLLVDLSTQSPEVAQLAPKNLDTRPDLTLPPAQQAAMQAANKRRRLLLTTLSMDVGRMGFTPWIYNQRPPNSYTTADPSFPPSGKAVAAPAAGVVRRGGESAFAGILDAVNLDGALTPYPHQLPGSAFPSGNPLPGGYHGRFDQDADSMQKFVTAQGDRQKMAEDLFTRALVVTGVPGPADLTAPTDTELVPLRWLAQLAANIVDFIDEDEINTPFNFYPAVHRFFGGPPATLPGQGTNTPIASANGEKVPKYWVFGTELPPVVLNEVHTEYQLPLDNMGNKMSGPFKVNVWAELHNAFPTTVPNKNVQGQDTSAVPLRIGSITTMAGVLPEYSTYQVVIANKTAGAATGGLLDRPDNVLGTPDTVRNTAVFGQMTVPVVSGMETPPMAVDPQRTGGLFLVGPPGNTRDKTITTARVDGKTPWYQDAKMQYDATFNSGAGTVTPDDRAVGICVLVRRLANPHLPAQDDPGAPLYNPYVTVDYLDGVPLNDGTDPNQAMSSKGKRQPYASHKATQVVDQTSAADPMSKTQHTLGMPNSEPAPGTPKQWLTHLDRQLISPFELLNVSGFRPHQLTHEFINSKGPFQHRVPWFDEDLAPDSSHRLYRLFAFMDVGDRAAGVSPRGRLPGRINLNTIWDYEVFAALCDPQTSNYFTEADVRTAWRALLQTRSPGLVLDPVNPAVVGGQLNGADRPLLDPAAGHTAAGFGLEDTIFRRKDPTNAANTLKLFQTNQAHPYLQHELLNKIAHSATTRSNVFGVWLTTGFFEVVTDPVKGDLLGEEIGRASGKEIRYRFFSVVDRTQLVIQPQLTTGIVQGWDGMNDKWLAPSGSPQWINIQPKAAPTDPLNGISGTMSYQSYSGPNSPAVAWQINAGSILVINRGSADEETVVVTGVDTTTNPSVPAIQAVFRREHKNNQMSITMPGNPGPQPTWNPYSSSEIPVVPYWEFLGSP